MEDDHAAAGVGRRRAVPLSNRRGTRTLSKPFGGIGVGLDRVSLSFPVTDFEPHPAGWASISEINPGGARETRRTNYGSSVVVDGVKVFVGVALIGATGQTMGKVEFNPSRIVDPDGYGVATLAEAKDAAGQVWAAAGELVAPAVPIDEAKAKRLDVTKDFGQVDQPANLIRGLAPIHRPWAKRNLVHADPQRHGAQTLMVGGGPGVVRLYDKWAETQGKAPAGTVRWEAECRAAWLGQYGGMSRWADVTDQTVGQLARNRWEWSAMGAEVSGTSRVVDKVAASDLSEREQCMFLGWLVSQAAGKGWQPGSKTTLAKWRKVQRDIGVAVGDLSDGQAGFVSRLDWDTGREVLRVA
jgi:hypothetical protein